MSWKRKPLEEVANFCLGKMLDENKNRGQLMPYLANINVRWGKFDLDDLRQMRFEERELDRFGLKSGDVVMCEGGEPGRCAIWQDQLSGMMFQKALHRIRPHRDIDSSFLFYLFLKMGRNNEFAGLFTGSTIKHLPKEKLAKVVVAFPELDVQQRIAAVLSTYDALIENNRRRIALLEQAARQLYKEWFVRFRFPGHQRAKFTNDLPKGWGFQTPEEFIVNHIGGGWGSDYSSGKDIQPAFVIRGTDLPSVEQGDVSCVQLRYHGVKQLQARKLEPFDIIFEVSGGSTTQPVARTLIVTPERLKQFDGDVICASFCKRFSMSRPEDAVYFYYHIRESRDRGDILVYQKESASALKNFNFESFMSNYRIPIPPEGIREKFFDFVVSMLKQQVLLSSEISLLAEARDLLLPRLMSGEVEV